jgi:hypothetical protein
VYAEGTFLSLSPRWAGSFLRHRPSKGTRVPILPVSLNGERPSMRTVQLRTGKLTVGVLCEVWADGRMHLCLIEHVNADGSFVARSLPNPPSNIPAT